MKSGILGEDEGFDLLVDGQMRSFRDVYDNALGAARVLKARNRMSIVEIRTRGTGHKVIMLEDGRLG